MAIPSRQIGWGTEENLLWQISKQLEAITGVAYNAGTVVSPVTSDLIPALDNIYNLGSNALRWKSIHIGEGTIYITDTVTGATAALTVTDGVLFIDGAAQLQVQEIIAETLQLNNTNGDAYMTFTSDGLVYFDGNQNILFQIVNNNGVGQIIFGGSSQGGYQSITMNDGLFVNGIQYQASSGSIKPLSYNTSTKQITYDSSNIPFIYTSQVPAHSYGVAGNVKNNFTYDNTYFYICTADYQGDAINIWKRIAWTAGTW
jgi:hypothetical protein